MSMRPKSREKGINLLFSLPKLYLFVCFFYNLLIKLFHFTTVEINVLLFLSISFLPVAMPEAVEGGGKTVGGAGVPGSVEGKITIFESPLEPAAMVVCKMVN